MWNRQALAIVLRTYIYNLHEIKMYLYFISSKNTLNLKPQTSQKPKTTWLNLIIGRIHVIDALLGMLTSVPLEIMTSPWTHYTMATNSWRIRFSCGESILMCRRWENISFLYNPVGQKYKILACVYTSQQGQMSQN